MYISIDKVDFKLKSKETRSFYNDTWVNSSKRYITI